jgi:hypothetical protein
MVAIGVVDLRRWQRAQNQDGWMGSLDARCYDDAIMDL